MHKVHYHFVFSFTLAHLTSLADRKLSLFRAVDDGLEMARASLFAAIKTRDRRPIRRHDALEIHDAHEILQ